MCVIHALFVDFFGGPKIKCDFNIHLRLLDRRCLEEVRIWSRTEFRTINHNVLLLNLAFGNLDLDCWSAEKSVLQVLQVVHPKYTRSFRGHVFRPPQEQTKIQTIVFNDSKSVACKSHAEKSSKLLYKFWQTLLTCESD